MSVNMLNPSLSTVLGPAEAASPRNLPEMQTFSIHPWIY